MTDSRSLPEIDRATPVLIAGATASGKSDLALEIAKTHGGAIVNADASQVYACWRVVTARPSPEDEARAPHQLYGHVAWDTPYSAGHWLRDVAGALKARERPIIVGGTGLYFSALTEGLADIPATPPDIRARADALPLGTLLDELDAQTRDRLDICNRARVQRAWEVQAATGRSIAAWQAETPPPLLPTGGAIPILVDVPKDRLIGRIDARFDRMLAAGALDEVACMLDRYDPALPAFRAIGVPELAAYLKGELTLNEARLRATVSTRQFAKRQRTWFRSRMKNWYRFTPPC